MFVSAEAKLISESPTSYESIGGSPHAANCSSENNDLSHVPNKIPLKQMVSGGTNGFDEGLSNLNQTEKAHLAGCGEGCFKQDSLSRVYTVLIAYAIAVAVTMILQIYLCGSLKGLLVSDHEWCTTLGQRVLHDQGSSVDAAIVAALCLGVVHPHASGIGGGGVMLVHDICKNESRVIDFQGTAPEKLREEMLQNAFKPKAGLQVAVPGMLRGLHQAHILYGSLTWEDVITRVADVAKEGFSVSHSLADAISNVKGDQLSQHFKNTFLPEGRGLHAGSLVRAPSLAGVLEAGLSNFYSGDLSQEMEDEVQAHGGVLSRQDFSNYSVKIEQPVEGLYHDLKIQVPPPPSIGVALISALNLLEGFNLSTSSKTVNQTYHWIAESLKAALGAASGLGDPLFEASVAELLSDMISKSHADVLRQKMNYTHASLPEHYSAVHDLQTELVASQVLVMGPDNLVVSVASSLTRPFGSRIITRSGIILNSHILEFSWPNKTKGQLVINQRNRIQPNKRPLSSLMPTIVLPAWFNCRLSYMALSNSDGDHSLSGITQVVLNVLFNPDKKKNSLSVRRIHPQLQTNTLLVEPDFPEVAVQFLREKGHVVQRVKILSVVQGLQRSNDLIKPITPHLSSP